MSLSLTALKAIADSFQNTQKRVEIAKSVAKNDTELSSILVILKLVEALINSHLPKGDTGSVGPVGPRGEKGDTGDPGKDAHMKGDKGNAGYTPVKGLDYVDGKDGENGNDGGKHKGPGG